ARWWNAASPAPACTRSTSMWRWRTWWDWPASTPPSSATTCNRRHGVCVAFAVPGIVVLVPPPVALYMVTMPVPPAIRNPPDVPASQTTILQELTAAGRGLLALVTGDRKAATYFDFSQRGLAGSFIAFLTVTGLNAALPVLLGYSGPAASIS